MTESVRSRHTPVPGRFESDIQRCECLNAWPCDAIQQADRADEWQSIAGALAEALRGMVAVYYETGMEDSEPVRALARYDALERR